MELFPAAVKEVSADPTAASVAEVMAAALAVEPSGTLAIQAAVLAECVL